MSEKNAKGSSAIEKLEARLANLKALQDKLIERKKAIQSAREAIDKKKIRQLENQRKYEFGGLVLLAECDWDKGTFLGSLLDLREKINDVALLAEWKRRGDAELARRENMRRKIVAITDRKI